MTEPTTAAGRALLDELVNRAGKPNDRLLREQINAIEAEARQQDASALTEERLAKAILASVHYEPELSRFTFYEDDGPQELAARLLRAVALAALPPSAPPALDVEPWEHPYEADSDDMRCRHCGWIGSYAHTRQFYEKWVWPAQADTAEYARLEQDHD